MQTASRIENKLPVIQRQKIKKPSIEELQQAFSTFSAMSEQLSDSYNVLEQRVVELSGELASLSEQRLRELNEKEQIADQLESLLRLMPAAVIVLDNRGIIRQSNPMAEKWIYAAMGEPNGQSLTGKPWGWVVRLAFTPKHTDYHEVSLKDGRLVSLETSPLDNSGQLIMMTDQTETRALQNQVARQERLTAMGQMVASLAHQVRTPLSAALLYASNLKSPKLPQHTHDTFVDKLVNRLNHIEKQVQDMLLFVKGECHLINRVSVVTLTELLKEAALGLPNDQYRLLHWQVDASPDGFVQCQSDALISAFMNVINNAIEAVGQQANISISVSNTAHQATFCFKDNGAGLTPEQIQKIQEPFYTTKSHGTGLGIPVLVATIKAHKGDLSINSQLGEGTEFLITLPILQKR